LQDISVPKTNNLVMLDYTWTQDLPPPGTDVVSSGGLSNAYYRNTITSSLEINYSDTSIPAVVYTHRLVEAIVPANNGTLDFHDGAGGGGFPGAPTCDATGGSQIGTTRVVAVVGSHTHVLSEQSGADTGYGINFAGFMHAPAQPASPFVPGVTVQQSTSSTTLPNGGIPNRFFCGNRNPIRGSAPAGVDPSLHHVEFAARDKNTYIGSGVFSYDPDASNATKRMTWSHDDAALKKTIVNYVLPPVPPALPIEGAALDDYEIWFTAIRAI
jgi:hypothetical protein